MEEIKEETGNFRVPSEPPHEIFVVGITPPPLADPVEWYLSTIAFLLKELKKFEDVRVVDFYKVLEKYGIS